MTEEEIVKKIDGLIDKVILITCLFMLFLGSYALLDSYSVFYHASDNSLLKIKQEMYESGEIDKNIQGLAAWLSIDETTIDFPVMQGITNSEYLNKDPYGNFSMSGSIFLDSRNTKDFSDQYNLLYGHHMENYAMFGALDKFLQQDYFDSHITGELVVGSKKYKLQVFAVVECDSTEQAIFAPHEGLDHDAYIRSHYTLFREPESDQYLAMSTCKYPNSTERTIVICSMVEDDNTRDNEKGEKI